MIPIVRKEAEAVKWKIVYKGGHHVVFCDGRSHWCRDTDGRPDWRQGECNCAALEKTSMRYKDEA
jgi:hypothetical protein